ncbi:DUF2922 domain-containing protein [Vagococcus sp.]|uniref:DUF2922 domain-containing protein n=1 Tax=Vagococcus sp. TaxID=1933889 RepID=UPI003F9A3AEF
MKKLNLTFLNAVGKQTTLTPTIAKQDLTADEVKNLMAEIIKLKAFEKEGTQLYTTAKSAKYVETVTTDLF